MTRGINDTSTFTVSVTDTADHYLPDTESGADGYDVRTKDKASVYVTNTHDQSGTVSLEMAPWTDSAMSTSAEIDSATVAAGEMAILSVPGEVVPGYLRVKASFGTAPASGSLDAVFAAEENG